METKDFVQTLETPTEATGSPSEGSGQSWGLFSSRRPHLPQPFPLCFANPPCVRNPRAVTSVPSPFVPSQFPPRDWASASARRLPPADSTASPASNASLGSPPPSGPSLPQSATACLGPPPPASSRRLPPSPSVWCRAVRRPPFGTDRKRSKLGSWARTSARALGTHGSPPPVAEGHRNGSPPPSAAGPPRPRPFSHGPWSCRRPWNRRPPATRWSWELRLREKAPTPTASSPPNRHGAIHLTALLSTLPSFKAARPPWSSSPPWSSRPPWSRRPAAT